jgi:DNA-binding IclR family transcriptional regulator
VSDPVARRIAAELPRIFTAQNLADLVQQDKRTAQRTIATWLGEGMIEQVQLGRYSLTERERH